MKAAVFRKVGDPLAIEDIEVDAPGPNEVRIHTAACGVCHSDLHIVQGVLPWPPGAVMGHEAAGTVTAVGSAVTYVKPGDRVVACPSPFCGKCAKCLTGNPHLCAGRGTLRRRRNERPRLSGKGGAMTQFADIGGYAEELLLHENAVVKIPDAMPLDRAALIGCGVTTGMGAVLNTARIEPGSTVAVFGCGGVGIAAIQGARIAGARMIIAVDQFENKLAMAKRFGATHTVDASNTDAVAEIQKLTSPAVADEPVVEGLGGAGGVDYAFEAVGVKKLAEQCFDAIRPGGTATIIGMIPVGQKVELDGPKFLTERKIQGTNMGSNRFRIDMPRYIDYYLQGRLNLDDMISRRGKLEDVNEAFRAMKAGEVARTVLMFE
jgi:S-(hydroxymethyl)glutathione dehydrogenase/alcohol dehydrogenase